MIKWNLIPVQAGVNSMPNLYVLSVDGVETGFVEKPRDSRTCKNLWRAFIGIGFAARFLGHAGTCDAAMSLVVSARNTTDKQSA